MDRAQGWSDTPLTQQGIETAKLLGKGLRDVNFAAAYSSDSGRAVETAAIILNQSGWEQPIYRDKRLREWGFGSLEGEPNKSFTNTILQGLPPDVGIEQLNDHLPQIADLIAGADSVQWAENFSTIEVRLKSVFNDMAEVTSSNGGGNILVVTHAFTIKTLIYLFAGHRMKEVSKIKNASITKVVYQNSEFKIGDINDTHYFDHGKEIEM